jgi:hypothetical protein
MQVAPCFCRELPKVFHSRLSCFYISIDIDECSLSIDNCHQNSNCTNIDGSFLCTCDSGYTGNGTVCQGIIDVVEFAIWENKSQWKSSDKNRNYNLVHRASALIALRSPGIIKTECKQYLKCLFSKLTLDIPIFKTLLQSYEAKVLSLVVYTCQVNCSVTYTNYSRNMHYCSKESIIYRRPLNSRECFEGHEWSI